MTQFALNRLAIFVCPNVVPELHQHIRIEDLEHLITRLAGILWTQTAYQSSSGCDRVLIGLHVAILCLPEAAWSEVSCVQRGLELILFVVLFSNRSLVLLSHQNG